MLDFLRRRLVAPVVGLLMQGIGPRAIALSIAIGLIVGVFPVLGTTTVLCTAAALVLRLNLIAIHAVHYAATPLQILLIIPFVRVGEHLTGAQAQPLSISEGLALIDQGVGSAVVALWDAIVHAVVGWLAIGPLALALVYVACVKVLERVSRLSPQRQAALLQAGTNEVPP
jgi:uncharacterized protein (DUF2062 family)